MRRQFKNTVDYLKKENTVMMQRSGDSVLLSEGHIIVMIPSFVYEIEFMTANPRFIRLEDGDFARSNRKEIPMPEKTGTNLLKMIEDYDPKGNCSDTRIEIEVEKSWQFERLFLSDDERTVIAINAMYNVMLDEIRRKIGEDEKVKYINDISPLLLKNDDYGFLVLPINTRNNMWNYPFEAITNWIKK